MKIKISEKIFSGNLGDGWTDNDEAAQGLAQYTEARIREFMGKYYPDHEVEIDIDVQRVSGSSRPIRAYVDRNDMDEDELDAAFELEQELEDALFQLTEEIWVDFCQGDGAEFQEA